jgi:hypothetical protein
VLRTPPVTAGAAGGKNKFLSQSKSVWAFTFEIKKDRNILIVIKVRIIFLSFIFNFITLKLLKSIQQSV